MAGRTNYTIYYGNGYVVVVESIKLDWDGEPQQRRARRRLNEWGGEGGGGHSLGGN